MSQQKDGDNHPYRTARRILGNDFVTASAIQMAGLRIRYSRQQINNLVKTLPTEEVIRALKAEGFCLVARPPLPASPGWSAIKKTLVKGSQGLRFGEQLELLSETEYVPSLDEASWFVAALYEVCGVRLFEGVYGRTSKSCQKGLHYYVGDPDVQKAPFISQGRDDVGVADVGLFAAYKL